MCSLALLTSPFARATIPSTSRSGGSLLRRIEALSCFQTLLGAGDVLQFKPGDSLLKINLRIKTIVDLQQRVLVLGSDTQSPSLLEIRASLKYGAGCLGLASIACCRASRASMSIPCNS